jgi:hypothetical protein
MAKKKQERLVITIHGIAQWPKLSTPDVYTNKKTGKSSEPAYKVNIQPIDLAEQLRVEAILNKFAADKFDDADTAKRPTHIDKKTEDLSFSMKRSAKLGKCPAFDAKNHKLPDDASIGGGSELKVNVTVNDYDDGINLYLNAIQVIKLEEDTYGKSPFEETSGYEHDDSDAGSPFKADDAQDDLAL